MNRSIISRLSSRKLSILASTESGRVIKKHKVTQSAVRKESAIQKAVENISWICRTNWHLRSLPLRLPCYLLHDFQIQDRNDILSRFRFYVSIFFLLLLFPTNSPLISPYSQSDNGIVLTPMTYIPFQLALVEVVDCVVLSTPLARVLRSQHNYFRTIGKYKYFIISSNRQQRLAYALAGARDAACPQLNVKAVMSKCECKLCHTR